MIDLTKLSAAEAERLAYVEGYTGTAALFARIAELEHTVARYEAALEAISDGGRLGRMTATQCGDAAREVLP